MFCCDLMRNGLDDEAFFNGAKYSIQDGRITNDLDTEYFIRMPARQGYSYIGINYCPFCGQALSTGLWVAEKKK